MTLANIIKRPIITEKSLVDAKSGIFTFEVAKDVGKFQIKKHIEDLFKVHVKKITSTNFKGKKRLTGRRRIPKYDQSWKKVWVKLAAGEKIDLFEMGEQK